MSRGTTITVEDLAVHEHDDVCAEWDAVGRRLAVIDPDAYHKVLEAGRTLLSCIDRPNESEIEFTARLRRIRHGPTKVRS